MVVKRINNINPRFCLFEMENKIYMVDMYSNKLSYISLLLHTTFKKKAYILTVPVPISPAKEEKSRTKGNFLTSIGFVTLGVFSLRGLSGVHIGNNNLNLNVFLFITICVSILIVQKIKSLNYEKQINFKKLKIDKEILHIKIKFRNRKFSFLRNSILLFVSLLIFLSTIFSLISFLLTGSVTLLIVFTIFFTIAITTIGHAKYFSTVTVEKGMYILEN